MGQTFSLLVPFIPVFPLVAFLIIVFGVYRNNKLSAWTAIGGIGLSTLVSWYVFFMTALDKNEHIAVEGWGLKLTEWLPTGDTYLSTGVAIDGFTAAMLFMVPFVCTLIFIYASEYMEGDPRYSRFFAYVSLFAFGMLTLVVADNLLLLFMAWEIMGLCSYLLIGFWFEKPSAKKAALKAFLTTRVGDVLLFSGMLLLYSQTGTLTFREIFQPEMLVSLRETLIFGLPAATVTSLLIFGGSVGKSAQFPLHVWLPDAMEGPTPVSAMIHAATMVSAGVYLVARMLPLFATVPQQTLYWVAIIGSITAFFGATVGIAQNDIKRVLAYSTISQLGYMMIGLGLGGFLAGVFHMLTHAFFKALLFLGSGSIIHAVEHGAHDTHDHIDPQDMMNMGGLYSKMKRTAWAYFLATGALVGIFPLAGFWSKDEILAEAWHQAGGFNFGEVAFWAWLAGTAGAFITALYMGRQLGLVFFGKPRTKAAEHAHEPGNRMTIPLLILAFFAVFVGFTNVPTNYLWFGSHEVTAMPIQVPVIGNGWLHHFAGEVHLQSTGELHGEMGETTDHSEPTATESDTHTETDTHVTEDTHSAEAMTTEGEHDPASEHAAAAAGHSGVTPGLHLAAVPLDLTVALVSTVVALSGLLFGLFLYSGLEAGQRDPLQRALGPLFTLFKNKYYIDEIYQEYVVNLTVDLATFSAKFDYDWVINPTVNLVGRIGRWLGEFSAFIDKWVVDGVGVLGTARLFRWFGKELRTTQTGQAQNYLLVVAVASLSLIGMYLFFLQV